MTSINALKLSEHSGLLVCDEARYWNEEWMIFYTPEKIRRITDRIMQNEQKLVMFMGQTGTSSIGDEWIEASREEIAKHYQTFKRGNKHRDRNRFMNLNLLTELVFEKIISIKQKHIDDFLKGTFGFGRVDLLRGWYLNGTNEKIKVDNNEIVDSACNILTNEGNPEEVKGIYGNSQIIAGYHPQDGFRIFYLTEKWPVCEEVSEIFLAQGSGRDVCDLALARLADSMENMLSGRELTPAKGLFILLQALDRAMHQIAGVGGYPKIIYIDGSQSDSDNWVTEISDYRSKLALEISSAASKGLISSNQAEDLLQRLIFLGEPFLKIHKEFFEVSGDKSALSHFLRGYI